MKTSRFASLLVAGLVTAIVGLAAEKEKEVTLTGMGQCAKCSLGKTSSCQNAVVVTQDGKEQVYLVTENEVSKKFHDEVCESAKAVKVTGVVKETKDGKEITASKIELVKKAS